MRWPKISVVVPSFNQGRFLQETLRSVIDQQYENLELIVIDGGSTDDSVEIIQKYAPSLSYWVSEPDGGQTKGIIKGFKRSTGEIQCWLNSDDLHEPYTLREVAQYFLCHPGIDAVFGNALWIDESGRSLREQREIPFNKFIWLHTYNYVPGMSMFWRRAIYERVGGLDPMFDLAMDADLWIRFAHAGRIDHVRKVWSRMRFYASQKNRQFRERSNYEDSVIRRRYWGTSLPVLLQLKQTIAQCMRIGWKCAIGCYPFGYQRYMESQQKT